MEKLRVRKVLKDHPSNNWQTWYLGLVNSKVRICSFSIKMPTNFIFPHLKSDLLAAELNVLLLFLLMHYYWGSCLLNYGTYLCFIRCSVWFLQAVSFAQRLFRRWESSDDAKVTVWYLFAPCTANLPFHTKLFWRKIEREITSVWQGRAWIFPQVEVLILTPTTYYSIFLQDFT